MALLLRRFLACTAGMLWGMAHDSQSRDVKGGPMKKTLLMFGCALALAACEGGIDTSNPEAFASSIAAVTEKMSPEAKEEFRQAMIAIAFETADPSASSMAATSLSSPALLAASAKIRGKTADEIIRLGYETQLSVIEQEMAEDAAAIATIKEERRKHDAIFNNIHIDNPRYSVSRSMIIEEPVISFRIANNSNMPIKTVYLHAVLTSPGRAIPWVSSGIRYEFSGGLEAGETQHLDVSPNMFGDWKVDARYSRRPDLKLELTLANVENASGEPLLTADPGDAREPELAMAAKEKRRAEIRSRLARL